MGLFKKKVDRDEIIKQGLADSEAEAASQGSGGGAELTTGNEKIDIELTKIRAQLESMSEVRKVNQERFSRISEQMGELRGMIVDTNKMMSKIEVTATKAVDLVESVHPEKLMVEVRKQDGKIEALRANIDANETVMKDIMIELKKMREQVQFYKGTEQVIKLNEEVKQELANIKKMEAVVERHADRVETIFVEVEKKFTSFEKYDGTVQELTDSFKRVSGEFEKVRATVGMKEDKKEFVDLLDKFNNFEKHTTNLLKLLDDRSKMIKTEVMTEFKKLRNEMIADVKKAKKKGLLKGDLAGANSEGIEEKEAEGAEEKPAD